MTEFKIVEVKEIVTKDNKKFLAYKTIAKNGKKMDVRFKRDCLNVPKEPCVICVENGKCNVDETRQYPILWISEINSVKPLERKSNIAEYFDVPDSDIDPIE